MGNVGAVQISAFWSSNLLSLTMFVCCNIKFLECSIKMAGLKLLLKCCLMQQNRGEHVKAKALQPSG